MKPLSPFSFTNDIGYDKKDILKTSDDPNVLKQYKAFIINRQFSYFSDTVLYANEMNMRYNLDEDLQFDYLFHSIRKRKRFSKWSKPEKSEDILIIQEYYKCNVQKARDALKLLSKDGLTHIKLKMTKGGRK